MSNKWHESFTIPLDQKPRTAYQILASSKSTKQTLEKDVKYVQS